MAEASLGVAAILAAKVTFASHQNSVPILRELKIQNTGADTLNDLTVTIEADPPVVTAKRWPIDRISADATAEVRDLDVALNAGLLLELHEAITATVTIRVLQGDLELACRTWPLEALAQTEWGGAAMPELLAAFVMPNDPAVDTVLRDAGRILVRAGKSDSQTGYLSGHGTRVWEVAAAVWSAVVGRQLAYSLPPASFETEGQKVRTPSAILSGGLATCLDTACLFAAALEQAGLNPIVVLIKGHAFAGVWLQPEPFSDILTDEASALRKRVKLQELICFETTLATNKPAPAFSAAIEAANRQIAEEREGDFVAALDIRRARMQRLRPLALRLAEPEPGHGQDGVPPISDPLEEPPPLPTFGRPVDDPVTQTSADRLQFWRRKLLDLTARNRLLNVSPSKTALRLVCPNIAALEDRLADGKKIKIAAVPALDAGGRDAGLHAQRTGEELLEVYARDALARDEVLSVLSHKDLEAALVELYRKARLDLQEGGANTLFLAVGFLSWKRDPEDTRTFRAPLMLVPVTLERKTARSDVRMMAHDDKARFNGTLLEMLRQDFEVRDLDGFEQELPQDESGIDVSAVLDAVRRSVRDMRGFEVVEDVMLGTFSFAKYLMWKDLTDRADQLMQNRVVKHLLETPRDPFLTEVGIPRPEELDAVIEPSSLFTPLPADSSQLAAVVASARGCDFVLDGPPGTGKSQTIANIIAHNVALGRKVLFVAEKMAALNVVYSRLEEHGLGAFCLELHSNKANKADVVRQLGRAWDTIEEAPAEAWARDSNKLKSLRDDLNEIVRLLHRPQASGMSLHQAIGRVVRDGGPAMPEFSWPAGQGLDNDRLARMRDVARRLDINAGNVTSLDHSAFAWVGENDWSPGSQAAILEAAQVLRDATCELEDALLAATSGLNVTVAPDPQGLEALNYLAKTVCLAHGQDMTFAFAPDSGAIVASAKTALERLKAYQSLETELSTTYAPEAARTIPIAALMAQSEAAARKIWPFSVLAAGAARKALAEAGRCANRPDLSKDLQVLARMKDELDAIDALQPQLSKISGWSGLHTKPEYVQHTLEIGAALQASVGRLSQSPEQMVVVKAAVRTVCIDANELLADGLPLRRSLDRYRAAFVRQQDALKRFRAAAKTPTDFGPETLLENIRSAADAILASRFGINAWCGWVRARTEALDLALGPLVQAMENGHLGDTSAADAFEVGFAQWLGNDVLESEPMLRRFLPAEHNAKILDFRKLDEELSALSSEAIRSMLSGKIPRKDDGRLPKAYGALKYQLGLKAPRKAIRELAAEMGDALTTLTPCLLMSPLSVAQYLPAETALFDLVIFDEASQITPWDAIGAIARGRQLIVAGDPKQMPPTNFFNRGGGSDDGDGVEEEDQESVLEQCLAANLPHHRLTWHYRSRHESLIAFSNQRYYDGELITFPAAVTRDSAVSFVRVEGVYAKGKGRTNAEEAKAIVAEVVRRLRDPGFVTETGQRQSLGVITLNSEQQKLVEDLLDVERRRFPEIESYFDESLSEPVIVKNLETIQGDERDLILLSVGYGPDTPGAADMSMNFGPLNKDGGWRRWNVAVTRARREMMLFTSFPTGMIDINRSRARAVKDLRDYQDFAIRGPSALARADHGSVGGYDSPFEQAVARALRSNGWEITTQIGVSRFRIDLGVVHPDRPGDYLAGIECDGAAYHSAATARDRDKVRAAILRGLGWELLRVWSTDWWHDRSAALAKLDADLTVLLEESRRRTSAGTGRYDRADQPQGASSDPSEPAVDDVTVRVPTAEDDLTSPQVFESPPAAGGAAGSVRRLQTFSFRRADLSRFTAVLRPDLFYDPEYDSVLRELTAYVVGVEAPLRDDVLVERIARAHGFQRSGRLIRERVLQLKGRGFIRFKDDAGGAFIWADAKTRETWSLFRTPASDEDIRPVEDISSEELRAGAVSVVADDVAWELSRQLGIRRLSAAARQRIERAILSTIGEFDAN